MSARTVFAKYAAFARLGFREARAERGELLGRVAFFAMILGVFSAVWRAAAESAPGKQDPDEMLWYIAFTEWVVISAPLVQIQMAEDIRRGDVAYQLARPAHWLGSRLAHGLGVLALRAPVMLVVACVTAWAIVGAPARPERLLWAVGFGLLSSVAMIICHIGIGVVAFWIGDVMPVWWIWQKLLFVLGGMLLPLTFYPPLFVKVAMLTPFPALLAGPASQLTRVPLLSGATLAALLVLWSVIGWGIVTATFRRATLRMQLNGG
jgi:ABC-2 type transport system permease protein